jgi:hypothetical protein
MVFYGKKAQESTQQQVLTNDESAAEIVDTGIA